MERRGVGGAVDRAVAGVKTAVCDRRVVAEPLVGSATKGVEGEKTPVLTVVSSDETSVLAVAASGTTPVLTVASSGETPIGGAAASEAPSTEPSPE